MHLVDSVLQRRYRLADVVVDDGQIEEVAVRLAQHVGLFGEPLETTVVLSIVWRTARVVRRRRKKKHPHSNN